VYIDGSKKDKGLAERADRVRKEGLKWQALTAPPNFAPADVAEAVSNGV